MQKWRKYKTLSINLTNPKRKIGISLNSNTLVRNNQDKNFSGYSPTLLALTFLIQTATKDRDIVTKVYVDSFSQGNELSRQTVGLDF